MPIDQQQYVPGQLKQMHPLISVKGSFLLRATPLFSLASSSALVSASRPAVSSTHPLAFVGTKTCSFRASTKTTLAGANSMNSPAYWNRENSKHGEGYAGEIIKDARIVCLSDPGDRDNEALYRGGNNLPEGSSVLAVGATLEDFDLAALKDAQPNVVFVSHPKARGPLPDLLKALPTVDWVHIRSAGIDAFTSNKLSTVTAQNNIMVTNAKGCFSSTLAEYTMMACSYFAKDLPLLLRNKKSKDWNRYNVLELRGATLGIIGYGDIGRACAKLADCYGMKVLALRRDPSKSKDDPYVKECMGLDRLNELMSKSDYILVAAPLTEDTRGLVSAEAISHSKKDAVIINVGRGPIIDEEAMIEALKDGTLKGAGLDVTTIEPLPKESPLWDLDNVLLSPHNMDATAHFCEEACEMMVYENLPRYVRGKALLNPVNVASGY